MNSDQSQAKSWYQAQKDGQWKTLTNSLSQDPTLRSQLNNFITTIYQKFRQQKNLSPDFKPTIIFKGFFGWEDFPISTELGQCESSLETTWQETPNGQKIAGSETYSTFLTIKLSQKLLLSKLGMPKLISDYQETSEGPSWKSFSVSFNELIETITHEIAHAYQFLVNEDKVKSQCESTGERDSQGQLKYPKLAYEHTALTEEIRIMTVKLAEYQKFKNWWEGKEREENILPKIEKKNQKPIESAAVVKKTSEVPQKNKSEPEKPWQNLEKISENKLPAWALPTIIVVGLILLIGIIYLIFRKK